MCVSTAAAMAGTVAAEVVERGGDFPAKSVIEHPSGNLEVGLEFEDGDPMRMRAGTILRTARKLFTGEAHIPENVLRGEVE